MPKGNRYRKGDPAPLITIERKALQSLLDTQDVDPEDKSEAAIALRYLKEMADRADGHHYQAGKSTLVRADRHAQIALLAAEGKTAPEIAERLGVSKQTVRNHLWQWAKEREANPIPNRGDYRERFELIYRKYMDKVESPGWKHSQGRGDLVLDPDGNPEPDSATYLEALNGARRTLQDMVNLDGLAEPKKTVTARLELIQQAEALTMQHAAALGLELPRGTGE